MGGVVTLNEPYETLVPTSLYHVSASIIESSYFFAGCLYSSLFSVNASGSLVSLLPF